MNVYPHKYVVTYKKPIEVVASDFKEAIKKADEVLKTRHEYIYDVEDKGVYFTAKGNRQ